MPDVPDFLPSTGGFRFSNSWPKVPVTTIPGPFGRIPIGSAANGLCGGMVFAARDYHEKGLRIPQVGKAPGKGPLFDYVASRLIDSFELPEGPLRYYEWMNTPDGDTGFLGLVRRGLAWRSIRDNLPAVLADIDAGRLSCLGLVTVASSDPKDLGENHQVLAYGYERSGSKVTLKIYDPNDSRDDGIRLAFSTSRPAEATRFTYNGSKGRSGTAMHVRGFFRVSYSRLSPPDEAPDLPAGTVGSWIRLRHVGTGRRLHSHPYDYGHAGGSGQQQVTCSATSEDDDVWRVRVGHRADEIPAWGSSVEHGQVIRLEHVATNRNLHSHSGHRSPVTGQQEVTCYGVHGRGDGNDDWRLELVGAGRWAAGVRCRLVHRATGRALHSHEGFSHAVHTRGQQEVTGYVGRDDNDLWVIE